jgi:hypothetical protein
MRSVWFAGDVGFGREPVMSVIGEKYSVELARRNTHGADWTVLKLIDNDGTELGCRWHTDAEKREIAYALRALAEKLDPDSTKI